MMARLDRDGAGDWTPQGLAACVAGSDRRSRAALSSAVADLDLSEEDRLDEHARIALRRHFRAAVAAAEEAIRRHALRLLVDQMTAARADGLLTPAEEIATRLVCAGALRDAALVGEWLAQARHDRLVEALPVAVGSPDEPSLLVRLSLAPDAPVARAAAALLAAESRRRERHETSDPDGADLPLPLYRRLVWWVAAAMRGETQDAARDHALADAAARCLATHDGGERVDELAMRLAAAIDPRAGEIPSLLIEAIGDRRLAFFVAILAHRLELPFAQARGIVLAAEDDRLWLALRALKLDRAAIAQIGLALGEADPARDVEAFARQLDAIVAIPPEDAHAALMPLTLDPEFLAAIHMVEGER